MFKFLLVGLVVVLSGCTTPRVWLSKNDGDSGVVSYETYNPASDGGALFKQVIPCADFKVVANPITRMSNGNTGYMVSGNMILPLGDAYTERGELHYQCVGSSSTQSPARSVSNACYERCNRDQKSGALKISLIDCYQKFCH